MDSGERNRTSSTFIDAHRATRLFNVRPSLATLNAIVAQHGGSSARHHLASAVFRIGPPQ